jgi:hypothetical protein
MIPIRRGGFSDNPTFVFAQPKLRDPFLLLVLAHWILHWRIPIDSLVLRTRTALFVPRVLAILMFLKCVIGIK